MSTSAPPGPSLADREKRAQPRFELEIQLHWKLAQTSGTAIIRDMSASGARIEADGFLPVCGDILDLSLRLYPNALPMKLQAKVVRHTDGGGFAVQFQKMQPQLRAKLASILPRIGKPC